MFDLIKNIFQAIYHKLFRHSRYKPLHVAINALMAGEYNIAANCLREIIYRSRMLNDTTMWIIASQLLAETYLESGDYGAAIRDINDLADLPSIPIYLLRAKLLLSQGDLKNGKEFLDKAKQLLEKQIAEMPPKPELNSIWPKKYIAKFTELYHQLEKLNNYEKEE